MSNDDSDVDWRCSVATKAYNGMKKVATTLSQLACDDFIMVVALLLAFGGIRV